MTFPSSHAARESTAVQSRSKNAKGKIKNFPPLLILLFGFILVAPVFCGTARAQDIPDYRVKAAFVFNFGKFIEWPSNAFAKTNAPIVIGIFGRNPFHSELKKIIKDKTINGHPLAVRRISRLSDLKKCRIIFIGASETTHLPAIFREISRAPILTVSDADGFIKAGGMIQFFMEDDRIRFEINDAAARQTGLKISARLLMLAGHPKPK